MVRALLSRDELEALLTPEGDPQSANDERPGHEAAPDASVEEAPGSTRRFPRYRCNIPIRITVSGQTHRGTAEDIGFGGVAVRTAGGVPVSAPAEVTLCLPERDVVIRTRGRVAWQTGTDGAPLTGVTFDALRPEEFVALMAWFRRLEGAE